jgi:hypothetical protein
VLVSNRRLLAALTVAVALAAAGCGAKSPPEAARVGESTPPASPGAETGSLPPPSATVDPSKRATTPARTKSPATKPARTKPPATGQTRNEPASDGLRISNVSLTAPDENGFGRPVKGIHQEGCGSPASANIWYTVTVPGARFREAWYEYEVDAPAPLRGKSDFYEMVVTGDRSNVKTVIGPLPRRAANTAGGKIAITVVVVDNKSGDRVTARLSATLLPCD